MDGQDGLFPAPDTDAALAGIDESIAAERETLGRIEQSLKEHRFALARLEESRATLLSQARKRNVRARVKQTKTAAQRAGKGNVTKAESILRGGPLTKADLTKRMGINDGTVTYALRALEETGRARKTGERVKGSDVYEYVVKRGVTRPGDRR